MGPFIAGARSDCLLVLQGGHPSENIDRWTVSGCVCVRECVCMSRPALIEKLQMPLCVCIYVCVCVLYLSVYLEEKGMKQAPSVQRSRIWEKKKGNFINFKYSLAVNVPAPFLFSTWYLHTKDITI